MGTKRRKNYNCDDSEHKKVVKELDDLISSLKSVVQVIEMQVVAPDTRPDLSGEIRNPHI